MRGTQREERLEDMETTRQTFLGSRRRVWLYWAVFLLLNIGILQWAYLLPKKTDLLQRGLTDFSARELASCVVAFLIYSVALIGGEHLARQFDDPGSLKFLRWLKLLILGFFIFVWIPSPYWPGAAAILLPLLFAYETRRMKKLARGRRGDRPDVSISL
jgi:hypothetical protein